MLLKLVIEGEHAFQLHVDGDGNGNIQIVSSTMDCKIGSVDVELAVER